MQDLSISVSILSLVQRTMYKNTSFRPQLTLILAVASVIFLSGIFSCIQLFLRKNFGSGWYMSNTVIIFVVDLFIWHEVDKFQKVSDSGPKQGMYCWPHNAGLCKISDEGAIDKFNTSSYSNFQTAKCRQVWSTAYLCKTTNEQSESKVWKIKYKIYLSKI